MANHFILDDATKQWIIFGCSIALAAGALLVLGWGVILRCCRSTSEACTFYSNWASAEKLSRKSRMQSFAPYSDNPLEAYSEQKELHSRARTHHYHDEEGNPLLKKTKRGHFIKGGVHWGDGRTGHTTTVDVEQTPGEPNVPAPDGAIGGETPAQGKTPIIKGGPITEADKAGKGNPTGNDKK